MHALSTPEKNKKNIFSTNVLAPVQAMVQACIQCGNCTGSCPNEFAMDYTPRQLWRMVLMNQTDKIFHSKTFALCSDCYYCTLRCPRGLPLTEAMDTLKQIASRYNLTQYKNSIQFYKKFINSVRRHGRVNEMELMTLYFAALKNPLKPLRFASLGMKLMAKGKVSMLPRTKQSHSLDTIFRNIEAQEEQA